MRRARNASGPRGISLMPDGPFNSVILRAATRPSDVESAVSASADEGLHVCVFGSEAQAADMRRVMPSTANRTRRVREVPQKHWRPFVSGAVAFVGSNTSPRSNGLQKSMSAALPLRMMQ